MDFGSSSVKLNKIQTFNSVGNNTNHFSNINNSTDYSDIEVVDYNQSTIPETTIQAIAEEKVEQTNSASSSYNSEKLLSNLTKNSIFYFGTTFADDALGLISKGLGKKATSTVGKVVTSSVVKGIAAWVSGGSALSGTVEGGVKKFLTDNKITKTVKNLASTKLSSPTEATIKTLEELESKYNSGVSSNGKIWNWKSNKGFIKQNLKSQNIKTDEYTQVGKKGSQLIKLEAGISWNGFAAMIGVDYAASLVTNVVVGKFVKGHDWGTALTKDAKAGSTLLKSTWKVACSVAFEKIGSLAGPAGAKVGKAFGSVVGAEIGSFCTDVMFDNDEGWCAAAGAATAITATAAGVFTTALISAGVLSVSVPVGGAIVGAAIIVGAAVGTLIVWGAKSLFG